MFFRKEIDFNWTRKKTLFLISILALILISITVYFFFFRNVFSTENISLQISGPEEVISGKNITWLVTIVNNSETKVEQLNLIFEYPSGVFDKNNSVKRRESKAIEKLLPKQEINESFSGKIFGVKEEIKEAKAYLTYIPAGLSTTFENRTSFSTRISETSIIFSMGLPKKINPQEEFLMSLGWQSGFTFPLENVQVRLYLPEDFERTSLKLQGEEAQDKTIIFNMGVLNEDEGGQIKIKGKIEGEIGDQKLFRAEFGMFDVRIYEFVSFAIVEKSIKIVSSTLDVFRRVNGNYNYIASPGETLNYIIEFKNTGEDIYRNLSLEIELQSNVLDLSSIQAAGGKTEGKKIIFSSKDFPDLLFLGPYGEGELGLKVNVKEYTSAFHPYNGLIKEDITIGAFKKSFQTKVSSETSFSQKVYYNKEKLPSSIKNIFKNSGPFPLQSGQETKVVVVFNIKNLGNQLQGIKVETKLPKNVEFLGSKIYPTGAKFTLNQPTKELILNMKSLSAYLPSKIFAFQIKIKPETFPTTVTGKTKLSGKDTWTDKAFEITVPSLNTDLIQ